jgi:hypothetical protein
MTTFEIKNGIDQEGEEMGNRSTRRSDKLIDTIVLTVVL